MTGAKSISMPRSAGQSIAGYCDTRYQPRKRWESGSVIHCLTLCLFVLLSFAPALSADTKLAVSSSLRQVWPELLEDYLAYLKSTPIKSSESTSEQKSIKASFGSSGNLMRQLMQGAPFDIFLSAAPIYVEKLQQQGLTQGAAIEFASGQLTWVARHDSLADEWLQTYLSPADATATQTQDTSSPATALSLPQLSAGAVSSLQKLKIAIANPRHAPYGIAAKDMLTAMGLYENLEPGLLLGENAAQAMQFVLAGGADLALVPLSLLPPQLLAAGGNRSSQNSASTITAEQSPTDSAPGRQWRGIRFSPVEPLTTTAVRHHAVLLKSASTDARYFMDYLTLPRAQNTFKRHGFRLP